MRGRSSASTATMLPGGGAPVLSTLAVSPRPPGTACLESKRRPPRTRMRRLASPNPWRTDSTRAVSCACPRTKHGAGAACETPRPQQNARLESGALQSRAPSSRPCAAIQSAPTNPTPTSTGATSCCHCAPMNKPLSHAAAIQGSTRLGRARRVPAAEAWNSALASGLGWRPPAKT